MLKQPPHPGKILQNEYFVPRGLTITEAAKRIGVTRQALNNVLSGRAGVSAKMTVRLAGLLDISPGTIQQWQKDFELHETRVNRARRSRGRNDPCFITSSDLVAWAQAIDARYSLPQLTRMLVRAAVGTGAAASFPTAEDAQSAGWDGLVENSVRNAYVPMGKSGWELSTESNPRAKADSDYAKRKDHPDGVDPQTTTFVAVSARKWAQRRAWAAEKKAEKFWANVLAYDAVDLEQWLELCPEVAIWFATRVGLRPLGVQSLESFWNEFSLSTNPEITPALLLAGRTPEAEKLGRWLESGTGVFRILADSADEALAFVAAVCLTREETFRLRVRETIVATDIEQVRQLMSVQHQLTIGWRIEDPLPLGILVDQGHRAILPLGRSSVLVESPDIELSRLGRSQFVAAIKQSLSSLERNEDQRWEEEANRRARMSGRSITVYRGLFSRAGAARTPAWATMEHADELVPVVLANSWNEANEADRTALAKLAGSDYERIGRAVTRWRTQTDALVRRIGETWILSAPLYAWSLMHRYVGSTSLQRFRDVAVEVLGEADPTLDVEPSKRWLAGLRGKQFRHSNALREGLAESLILLAVVTEEALRPTFPKADLVSYQIVSELLGNKSNRTRWASLSGLLPRLAEAAPEALLAALEDDLTSECPGVVSLFEEEGGPFGGGARHPHLLWALEMLSWFPDYLPRTTEVLAKLDEVARQIQIKIVNRPSNSLSEIFCTWHRNTAGSLEDRLDAIDQLLRRHPKTAWELLLTLLPKFHGVSGNTAEPRWRPKPEITPVTYGEIWRANDEIIGRTLNCAGGDATKLSALISEIGSWSPEQRLQLIRQVETFAEASDDIEQRGQLWHTLRQFLALHRAHSDADWALPEAELRPFDHLMSMLEPTALWENSLWLFDRELPDLPTTWTRSIEELQRDADSKRQKVVTEVFLQERLDGILSFARRVKMPRLVGVAAAEGISDVSTDAQILEQALAADEDAIRKFAWAFAWRRRMLNGQEWSDGILNSPAFGGWPPEKKAEFCLALPEEPSTWQTVAQLGPAVEGTYWRGAWAVIASLRDREAELAIAKLLQFGRGVRALERAGAHPEKLSSATLIGVLEGALLELGRVQGLSDGVMLQYYLEQILEKLRGSSEVTDETLGRLEWHYLPLLRHGTIPKTLHRYLKRDPAFFATVISQAFKSEGDADVDPPDEGIPEEQRSARARRAWDLLNLWHETPGLEANGSFDPTALRDWVVAARRSCKARGRSAIGDDWIGRVLARVPSDPDGAWPHAVVRDLIEDAESDYLEVGIHAGRINMRGVYAKDPLEGGRGERALAGQYRSWSKTANRWRRTSRLLDSLADMYERFGRSGDVWSEQLDRE